MTTISITSNPNSPNAFQQRAQLKNGRTIEAEITAILSSILPRAPESHLVGLPLQYNTLWLDNGGVGPRNLREPIRNHYFDLSKSSSKILRPLPRKLPDTFCCHCRDIAEAKVPHLSI
jgi:hypothetical protein